MKKYDFFVGLAEFDDVEGPVISIILPKDFPLDISTSFQIADYALYVEGKAILETEEYLVLSAQFKVYDPAYDRKYKKYAVVAYFSNIALIEKIKSIRFEIENLIGKTIDKIKTNGLTNDYLEIELKRLYRKIENVLANYVVDRDTKNKVEISSILDLKIDYTKYMDFFFLVDNRLKLIVARNNKIIEDFMHDPMKFEVFLTSSGGIMIFVAGDALRKYGELRNIVEEVKNKLEHAERNGIVVLDPMLYLPEDY